MSVSARYQRMFESACHGIVLVDVRTGVILDANPAAIAIGVSEGLIWESPLGLSREDLEKLGASGSLSLGSISGSVFADGRKKLAQIHVWDAGWRLAEEERRRAEKLDSLARIAGTLAHDFNNLLTTIMGYSELVGMRLGQDHPVATDVEEIRKAGERAVALTRQLLACGRRQPMRLVADDLREAVAALQPMIRQMMPANIDVSVDLGKESLPVRIDRAQFDKAVLNLAMNAREAMPEGGRLRIAVAKVDTSAHTPAHPAAPAGSWAMLEIADSGGGMPPEIRDHAFEPFLTTKAKAMGGGLGLSATYGIFRQSGGYVGVESQPGTGTSFQIYLPGGFAP